MLALPEWQDYAEYYSSSILTVGLEGIDLTKVGSTTKIDYEESREISKSKSIKFGHLYLCRSWKEPGSSLRRLTLAILFPTGILSGDYNLTVRNEERSVVLELKCPAQISGVLPLMWFGIASGTWTYFAASYKNHTFWRCNISHANHASLPLHSTAFIGLHLKVPQKRYLLNLANTIKECSHHPKWCERCLEQHYADGKTGAKNSF